ncbi:putative outer membrane starch-binding protein [Arenibacter algicola]|uniref:Outer membrane starch-binding protein n=1 Tax=Arenibacter algicola TaxID=616991 RepID=A0ABY3AGS8_9FLAO
MRQYVKKNYLAILIALGSLMIHSCSDDTLDIIPRDSFADANVWTDEGASNLFLNDIYAQLPDGNNWYDPVENWSDNSICGFAWPRSRTILQQSLQNPTNNPSGDVSNLINWSTRYNVIRKCNLFIQKVTESSSGLSEEFKKRSIAEARFLRAYNYHILWMAYGGVPIITIPLDRIAQGDDIFYERSTSEETLKFITDECAAIYPDLLKVPETGRASKGAAMTLKGWCELFAEKWTDAAASNKVIIDELSYDLFPDYAGYFLLRAGDPNIEGIFYREYFPTDRGGRLDGLIGPTFTAGGAETSWGGINPTQDLVDDYAMDNGKPITDPTSGYNPQDPYKNREPRFYQSIVFNNSFFYNDTLSMVEGSKNAIDLTDKDDATQTGYYMRKRLDDNLVLGAANWSGFTSYQNYNIFRFAEVLLNFAEAQNESVGPDASVYEAINRVRTRAGIPDLPDGLSKDEMRTAIRRERRIELAFEDKRFWDLIRWKIAEININRPLKGMQITESADGELQYNIVNATGGDRKFDASKNYLFPIPEGVLNQNEKLDQNPNY